MGKLPSSNKKAMIACEKSNYNIAECFPEVRKTLKMPNGGVENFTNTT